MESDREAESPNLKRISVFNSDDPDESCVIKIDDETDFKTLLDSVARKLHKSEVLNLFSTQGAKISNTYELMDGDMLYTSLRQSHDSKRVLQKTNMQHMGHWITLNVGGRRITTTRSTLTTKEPESMLARMFSENDENHWLSSVDDSGAYLIDRNGDYLAPIIDYLRHGQLVIDDKINPLGVLEEAKFFGISSIVPQLEKMVQLNVKPTDYTPITRYQMSLSLMTTPANCELRCQGLNFKGADLSKLDLRFVNFKFANLSGANLSYANLSNVNFERADLTDAILDGANMMGIKLLCAQLEGASMRGCNFEDPAGSRANMEGANLKHVNMEGSHMAGVNLRVATMRNSNLKNCDLRGAVLAGADLENCDLSGCDLQAANLRGANLEGAAFEMMLNALHMSQTLKS